MSDSHLVPIIRIILNQQEALKSLLIGLMQDIWTHVNSAPMFFTLHLPKSAGAVMPRDIDALGWFPAASHANRESWR
jgi:hypothetical protein